MEITIKTHEDFRRDHVTVQIAGTAAEVRTVGERMTKPHPTRAERVVELEREKAEEAERADRAEDALIKARAKIESYDTDRHTERDRADQERRRASELKDRLTSSEELVQEERIRANNLSRRVAELERSLALSITQREKLEASAAEEEINARRIAARNRLLEAATTKVRTAVEILTAPAVAHELGRPGHRVLADAVNDALAVLDA